jgi:hypothetical protein
MEEAMPDTADQAAHTTLTDATQRFLSRWRAWWRARDELGHLDRGELDRIAGEFGMSAQDLEDLVARGPDAADLLYQRMRVLGITRADAEHVARGLMRDLECTCSCCNDKGVCEKDLARHPDDPAWKQYCPNAVSLEAIMGAKGGRTPT